MGVYYDFDEVDAFTVGAVGEPGARVFYLQARRGTTRVTVKCEKQQASAIAAVPAARAHRSARAHRQAHRRGDGAQPQPVDAAFVLGPVGLGYDRTTDRVLVQLEEVLELDENGDPIEDEDDRSRPPARVPHPRPGRCVLRAHRRHRRRPVGRRAAGARSPSTPTVTYARA